VIPTNAYTIRRATQADTEALERLAQLDSRQPLSGDVLVALTGGSIIAALSIDQQRSIADPFRASAAALVVLRTRAGALAAEQRTPALRERLRAGVRLPLRPAAAFD
jgi:hypothetical protein